MQKTVTLTITGNNEKETQDKEKALQILATNLNRDSLVILANKSGKAGVNEKIKTYQHFM